MTNLDLIHVVVLPALRIDAGYVFKSGRGEQLTRLTMTYLTKIAQSR